MLFGNILRELGSETELDATNCARIVFKSGISLQLPGQNGRKDLDKNGGKKSQEAPVLEVSVSVSRMSWSAADRRVSYAAVMF